MTDNHKSPGDNTATDIAAAQREYDEYYAVHDTMDINVVPLPEDASVPNEEAFAQQIPPVFRLASEIQVVDSAALAQLRSLGDAAKIISDVLNQQNKKLTALLGYLLRNEDEPANRTQTFEYGGAGVGFYSDTALNEGQLVEIKLFLSSESAAIYSIGQVISIEPVTASAEEEQAHVPQKYKAKALFKRISDNDRELMIRCCLHAQTRLLKKRANEREDTP